MVKFKAYVTADIPKNRLLSITEHDETPQLALTKEGEVPDFRSSGDLKKESEVTISSTNRHVWEVEAGEDLKAGASVAAGKDGTVVSGTSGSFGYVTGPVKKGEVAQVVKRSSGLEGPRGPRGYKGNDGAITEKQYNEIIERLEKLEGGGE